MNEHEQQVWSGLDRRLAGAEAMIPDPPAWRPASSTDRPRGWAVRLGPAFGRNPDAYRDRQPERVGRRPRRAGVVWVFVVIAAILTIMLAATIAVGQRSDPRPDLSGGPFGPTGVLRGSNSSGNVALLPDGRVLIMTGAANPELWDPATGLASHTASTVIPRARPTATLLLDGRVLVVGGLVTPFDSESSATDTAEIWDPRTEAFAQTGSMARGRVGHSATLLPDGRVLVAGGAGPDTAAAASAEVWSPATGQFTRASVAPEGIHRGGLGTGRTGHSATLTGDGRVLFWGGTASDGTGVGSSVVWDPRDTFFHGGGSNLLDNPAEVSLTRLLDGRVLVIANISWGPGWTRLWTGRTEPPPMEPVMLQQALFGQSAVLLQDGRVLVFGGTTSPADPTSAVEAWDPATETFSSAARHRGPIADRTLTLLPDGRVLIVGPPEPGESSSTIDVYTPAR